MAICKSGEGRGGWSRGGAMCCPCGCYFHKARFARIGAVNGSDFSRNRLICSAAVNTGNFPTESASQTLPSDDDVRKSGTLAGLPTQSAARRAARRNRPCQCRPANRGSTGCEPVQPRAVTRAQCLSSRSTCLAIDKDRAPLKDER